MVKFLLVSVVVVSLISLVVASCSNNDQKTSTLDSGVAITYTVWGRKECPNNSSLVYSGSVGGSYYAHSGAAADYLCEYDSYFIPNADGHDVPCAVCRRKRVSTVLMIPGKDTCYQGWNIEYYGYLNAHDYRFSAAASYVCMHVHPEFRRGGRHNYEGKLFHPVIGSCGSLPCPPYVNGYPLTCVVCSK
ncbi:unnamed protein product [Mytilus edulis]|uniref:Short-chain collagen C4-like n=1 Tax=Mytilus edulis TaxID=6550 RepID=A0A8S3U2K6_MYTED|nr:unnamed protein product [Mytilus edulis]